MHYRLEQSCPEQSYLLPPRERTLPRMLERQAARYGERRLLVCGGTQWSFEQARDLAAGQATTLARAGIGAGDRVAILCGNRPEFLRLFLAAAWLGAIAVPINTAARGLQTRYFLENSGARLLVIEQSLVGALENAAPFPPSLERVWVIDAGAERAIAELPACPFPHPSDPAPAAAVRPGQTQMILYTSGTTGPAKGVCCPHAQLYWRGVNSIRTLGIRASDVLCTTLPLFHTNALNCFAQALLSGATQVIEPRFSASRYWPSLIEHGATVTYLHGAMVPILLSRAPSEMERNHRTRVALAPGVPAKQQMEFTRRTGIALVDGYGSTETNFVIGSSIDHLRPGCMGTVIEGFQARVVDADDNELPDGEAGELVVRAEEPYAFASGYFGLENKTVEAWRNFWFHTGDRAVREADGYFRFIDRMKDAIRRRGENISSFEVEQVLLGHPAIEHVAVFPVPSELAEDDVMAVLVLRTDSRLSEAELIAFCEPRLPYFAIPRYIEFVDDLPQTATGRIQKYKLRERGVTAAAWDREAAGYRLKR